MDALVVPRVRALAAFASWNFGAQSLSIVLQFGYAAVTSRLVDDVGFGAYAVALSVSALITLLANGGLGQTVGRMHEIEPERISALAVYALLLGVIGSAILLFTADLSAHFWGTPAAAAPIRVLALAAALSPLSGLLAGLLRRQQRFRALAVAVVATNAIGMAIGVAAVTLEPSSVALVVSPTISTIVLAVALIALNRKIIFTRPRLASVRSELRFSSNVTALSVISYINGNLGKWAISRGVGTDVLGQWNRAGVVTTVPLEQAHRALQQAIYPEFRHDIHSNRRTQALWTDLLALAAWSSFPLATLVGVLTPTLIPILFGQGWDLAAQLALPLSVMLAIQIVATTLGAALEAIGRFRWILATHLTSLTVHAAGAVVAITLGDWWPVLVAQGASHLIQHVTHVLLLSRQELLYALRLVAAYAQAFALSVAVGACTWLTLASLQGHLGMWVGITSALVMVAGLAIGWRHRSQLPPVKILRRYL